MSDITPPRISTRKKMQVRFFRERNLDQLEASLNRWLAERVDREIVEVRQSVIGGAGGSTAEREVIVSVWYIDS